jgi:DNA polymerase-3 subunit gamma/tau
MLHEKYRPTEFDQFIGQDKAVARIKAILGSPSFTGGAFLFHGPSASGKTSLARVIATHVGCLDCMSLSEIKGQDCTVDSLRELSGWFTYCSPAPNGFKVAIINECHLMSAAARSYALELMENPGDRHIVVLTTTESAWSDETLWSRFYTTKLAKPDSRAIEAHVQDVAEREGIDVSGLNLCRFIQERHNNIRLILNDLEIEAAILAAAYGERP